MGTSWKKTGEGIDPKKKTPAHTMTDGVDYVPAKAPVLLGHHFSSIAGAGPIVGPIVAVMFGWLPAVIWVIFAAIFFGGIHDMGSIFASVRNKGKSLGEIIGVTMGKKGKKLFEVFAWLTLILVVAAFTNIVADTFVAVPEAATTSILFIILAIAFGYFVYRKGYSLLLGSLIGVILLALCIGIGNAFPIVASKNFWMFFLIVYIFIASVTPVWILLQPRDYLNSFLLYGMMIGGFLGLLMMRPNMNLPAFTAFHINGQFLFPMLFVTIACGAVSGFHSLVGSGTTAKQLDNEKDIKVVGYGSMLIEGVLAIIAIITAAYLTQDKYTLLMQNGGPINVFSDGLGTFMATLHIPFAVGKNFTALAISAFALTSLDTATRLARFIFQELISDFEKKDNIKTIQLLSNKYIATLITVFISAFLGFRGYQVIWPIFGSANQLLSALALLALSVWLKKNGKNYKITLIPMIFMFAVTLTALGFLIYANLKNYILLFFAVVLFIFAIILLIESKNSFGDMEKNNE